MCSAEIFQGKNLFIFVLSFTTSRHYYVTEIYPSVRKSAKDTMFIETPVPFANLCNFARLLIAEEIVFLCTIHNIFCTDTGFGFLSVCVKTYRAQ